MAYNGSGTFNRLYDWTTDRDAGVKIRADRFDAEMDGMATGLSTAITKDGQTTITANLPMAGFKHTGVGDASSRDQYLAAGQLQDGEINWVDGGGTADAITAAYTPTVTALVDGMLLGVRATAANATTTPTFKPDGTTTRTIVKHGGVALLTGDIVGDGHELLLRYDLTNTRWELLNPGQAVVNIVNDTTPQLGGDLDLNGNALDFPTTPNISDVIDDDTMATAAATNLATAESIVAYIATQIILPRSYLAGLTLSNNGTDSDHDIDIAVGQAVDSTNARVLALSSAITKRIDASWSVGTNQGGLDGTESSAGTPDADTTYHVWLIERSDTGVVDVLFSESATSPTMPTNYDYKRRIGSIITDSSANIIAFYQDGDHFTLDVPVSDYDVTNPGTDAVLYALTVPTGIEVFAYHTVSFRPATGNATVLLTSPQQTDTAPSTTLFTAQNAVTGGDTQNTTTFTRTNTSGQIRLHALAIAVDGDWQGVTHGWIDHRGRDA